MGNEDKLIQQLTDETLSLSPEESGEVLEFKKTNSGLEQIVSSFKDFSIIKYYPENNFFRITEEEGVYYDIPGNWSLFENLKICLESNSPSLFKLDEDNNIDNLYSVLGKDDKYLIFGCIKNTVFKIVISENEENNFVKLEDYFDDLIRKQLVRKVQQAA